jgi:hypothetical protein
MCCGPFDYDYPTFGGKHLRANRSHGRVGSILSDPMTALGGASADSNLTAPPDPINVDPDEESIDLEDGFENSDRDRDGLDYRGIDDMERIEPLKDSDTIEPPETDASGDSTASSRWRPRPLR